MSSSEEQQAEFSVKESIYVPVWQKWLTKMRLFIGKLYVNRKICGEETALLSVSDNVVWNCAAQLYSVKVSIPPLCSCYRCGFPDEPERHYGPPYIQDVIAQSADDNLVIEERILIPLSAYNKSCIKSQRVGIAARWLGENKKKVRRGPAPTAYMMCCQLDNIYSNCVGFKSMQSYNFPRLLAPLLTLTCQMFTGFRESSKKEGKKRENEEMPPKFWLVHRWRLSK